jgi:hypothetical protein
VIVIGAGMAGLLAAGMLRNNCEQVLEAQTELPNNHSAVLRFRSSVVGDTLNIPFRKVQVLKASVPWRNPVADALAYSAKTNGSMSLRSSITARGEMSERFVAPTDLVKRMASAVMAPIRLGEAGLSERMMLSNKALPGDYRIISTIPMPSLMRLLGWKDVPDFHSVPGYNINFRVDGLNAYATLYVPDPKIEVSRISITGDLVTVEHQYPDLSMSEVKEMVVNINKNYQLGNYLDGATLNQVFALLGFDVFVSKNNVASFVKDAHATVQRYAKIKPIDDGLRKRFILWATEKHNIYSLGRFATWRPGLLLDDVVNDIRVIQKIAAGGSYDARK